MTIVTSSSRISESVRSLSSSRPSRSSPWERSVEVRARRWAMISAVLASRRRRVERRRRLVRVGVHCARGRIERPSRTTRSAESLVARSSCCAWPDRSAENSARPTASSPMWWVSDATSTTSPLRKSPPPSRAATAVSAAARTWSPTAPRRSWWKAGAASRRCSIQFGSDEARRPGPVTRARAAYCTVSLPQLRAAVWSTWRATSGSLASSTGGPGTGKETRSPKRCDTSPRNESGSDRTERKARAMSSEVGPGTPMSVGCVAFSTDCCRDWSRVARLIGPPRRPPRPGRHRSDGPAIPTPRSSRARARSRRRGPRPARRRAGRPRRR